MAGCRLFHWAARNVVDGDDYTLIDANFAALRRFDRERRAAGGRERGAGAGIDRGVDVDGGRDDASRLSDGADCVNETGGSMRRFARCRLVSSVNSRD